MLFAVKDIRHLQQEQRYFDKRRETWIQRLTDQAAPSYRILQREKLEKPLLAAF